MSQATKDLEIREALAEFVRDIDDTGGLVRFTDGLDAPVADQTWTDLGATYLKACKALDRRPVIKKSRFSSKSCDDSLA